MKYGAYRRWKLAEKDVKKGKAAKKKGKPQPENKPDSFLNSIKNFRDNNQLGQGFGTRAEPPPNKSPITPNKPVYDASI